LKKVELLDMVISRLYSNILETMDFMDEYHRIREETRLLAINS